VRKTPKMLEVEDEFGKPLEEILFELYEVENLSTQKISERLEVSYITSRNWLKKAGFEIRTAAETILLHSRENLPSKRELEDLYVVQKKSVNEIANEYNVSWDLISKEIDNAGIERRTLSESKLIISGGITPTEEELIELYVVQNMVLDEIAERYNVSRNFITKKIDEAGIEKRTLSETKLLQTGKIRPSDDELIYLYEVEEMSLTAIAKKYKFSQTTIKKWLKNAGVITRNFSEAMRITSQPRYSLEEATEAYLNYSNSTDEPVDMQTFFRSYDPETLEVAEGSGPLRAYLRQFSREDVEQKI